MKRKTSSETGFIRVRLFAAFVLSAAAVSMAMLSFASTPSDGTLTDTSGPLNYTAGPFFQPNAFGNSIAGDDVATGFRLRFRDQRQKEKEEQSSFRDADDCRLTARL